MNQQNIRAWTLLDLLARAWLLPSPVEQTCFSVDGSTLAFSCADGSVALAPLADDEAPDKRLRVSADLGRISIRPRERPPVPLISTTVLVKRTVPLVASTGSDFLIGTETGAVQRLTGTGEQHETAMSASGAVIAIDHVAARDGTGGITAVSDGKDVLLHDTTGRVLTITIDTAVRSLAFSPSGRELAVAHPGGLSIWSIGHRAERRRDFGLVAPPGRPQWSDDGRWIACALDSGGFALVDPADGRIGTVADFPAPVPAIAWSAPGAAVVAAGAFRIAAWSTTNPPIASEADGALVTGRAGLVLVQSVAAHPHKPLVAAGHANGKILLARIGAPDEIPVGTADAAIVSLAWSPDGRHLAIGSAGGTAAVVTFPAQLLK